MKLNPRFSIKALLIVVTIVAVAIWWTDDSYRKVYSEFSPEHGQLTIFGKKDKESGQYKVKIRFTPIEAAKVADATQTNNLDKSTDIEVTHNSGTLLFHSSLKPLKGPLEFHSIVDKTSGTWLICDRNDQLLVVMILTRPDPTPDSFRQIWHPGIHIGWLRGRWARYFTDIKAANPNAGIPYEQLPNEMKLATVESK